MGSARLGGGVAGRRRAARLHHGQRRCRRAQPARPDRDPPADRRRGDRRCCGQRRAAARRRPRDRAPVAVPRRRLPRWGLRAGGAAGHDLLRARSRAGDRRRRRVAHAGVGHAAPRSRRDGPQLARDDRRHLGARAPRRGGDQRRAHRPGRVGPAAAAVRRGRAGSASATAPARDAGLHGPHVGAVRALGVAPRVLHRLANAGPRGCRPAWSCSPRSGSPAWQGRSPPG